MAGEFSQAQLDQLRSMYARGVLREEYDGKSIYYASMADLKQAIDTLQASLRPRGRRFRLATFRRE